MNTTHNIERSIIASLLASESDAEVSPQHFSDKFHRKLIIGINRMRELGKLVDFELLQIEFKRADKWSIQEDNMLIDIMTNTTPFGSDKMIERYIEVIKEEYMNSLDKRFAL